MRIEALEVPMRNQPLSPEVLTPFKAPSPQAYDPMSPPVVLDKLRIGDRQIFVVRDDLLTGGTKQRACAPFLRELAEQGSEHFVYASPFSGFAQIALAFSCRQLGLACRLFCEADPRGGEDGKHEFTRLAESFGAEVLLFETLAQAEAAAQEEVRRQPKMIKLPLGFDCEEFRRHLKQQLRLRWAEVLEDIGGSPRQVWLPVGSGTLVKTFQKVLSPEIQIQAVNVHVLRADDQRILDVVNQSRVKVFSARMPFHERAQITPAVPSNAFYDAKLWEFILKFAQDGDLWWNVAR